MKNYAEELTYWYLRLNGFFPLGDFVLHHKGGDTDILAIRPPFACEYVRGRRLKEDELLIKTIKNAGCDFFGVSVSVIAEAKGGFGKASISRTTVKKKFDLESLSYNVRRLGLFKESEVDAISRNLEGKRGIILDRASVHKILFAHSRRFSPKPDDVFSFISLEAAKSFIEERMGLDFKITDWDKFDSNMIQDIILQNLQRS